MSFVGLRLFDDESGKRRLTAYLKQGVVALKPTEQDRKKPVGFYRMDWKPVDPRQIAMDWEASQHPRGGNPENAGEFSKGAGGGGVGKAPEAELAKAMATAPVSVPARSNAPGGHPGAEWLAKPLHGATFVSPNVAEHLDFPTAVAGLQSRRQRILQQASKDIDQTLGLTSHDTPAIGAWSDGAENSLMTEVDGGTWDQLRVAAAMKASLADQKAVVVFQEDPKGNEHLYSFPATGDLHDIHARLLEDGVAFHTIVPTKDGAMVYVVDLYGDAHDAVDKAAGRYGGTPVFYRGHGALIPSDDEQKKDGTDRQQRQDSRRQFERVVKEARVEGSAALWQRVHNTYGTKLDEVVYQPEVVAKGEEPARYATKQWTAKYDVGSGEDLVRDANRNQPGLSRYARNITAGTDILVRDPGVKGIKRINEKIAGGKSANQISDVARIGFDVKYPAEADHIVQQLSRVFEVADEDWRLTPEGYFDKTLKLKFPNGQVGEVQIYPPGLFDAKKTGHKLYEEWRSSKDPELRKNLQDQMVRLYGAVREKLPEQWQTVLHR